jgi:hypothetical protein
VRQRKEVDIATNAFNAQRLARLAGVLVLISILAGGFAEVYVPGRIFVAGDAAATARSLAGHPALFRISFAVYLIEAACDVTLALLFYVLLRPVNQYVSLLAAFFGLVSTSTFAFAELFYFVAAVPALDVDMFRVLTTSQRDTFTFIAIALYGYGGTVFMMFYGIATLLRGYLWYRSTYLPRIIGALLVLGGASFVVKNVAVVLAPKYDSDLLLLPMFAAMIPLTAWLLLKGIDRSRWPSQT